MTSHINTTIRLNPDLLKQLHRLAINKQVSLSRLIEEIISDYLGKNYAHPDCLWRNDPFFAIGRRPGRSGQRTIAANHNQRLY